MERKSLNKNLLRLSLVLVLVVAFQAIQFVSARTAEYVGPSSPPTEGEFYQPINTSENLQWKKGWLVFGSNTVPDDSGLGGIAIGRNAELCVEREEGGWDCGLSLGGGYWIKHEIDDYIFYKSGNVGIGTNNPRGILDVRGDEVFFEAESFNLGTERNGVLLTVYGNADIKGDLFSYESFFHNEVGIGVQVPGSKVDASSGEARVGGSVRWCDENMAGAIKFEGRMFYGCDGSTWKRLVYEKVEVDPILTLSVRVTTGGFVAVLGEHDGDSDTCQGPDPLEEGPSPREGDLIPEYCFYGVDFGGRIILHAFPDRDSGYEFDRWWNFGNDVCQGRSEEICEFHILKHQNITAIFKEEHGESPSPPSPPDDDLLRQLIEPI